MSSKKKTSANKEAARPALVPKLRFPEFRGVEGWKAQAIGSICKLYQAETIASSEFVDDGEHLVYGANGVVGRYDRYNHEFEEVVVSCRGNCGEVHLTRPRSWITGNSMVVSPIAKGITKAFLYRLLSASNLKPVISGSAQPQITRQGFSPFPVSIPSTDEQQKIAECLSSADELIAAQARKVDALKTHKKGLMQQLFPRKGEAQPRVRLPEFQSAGEWKHKTLNNIAKITSGSTPLRSNPEFFAGGTIPWVKTTDLNNSFIIDTEEKITPKAKARVNPAGSVLIAMYGGFNQIGRTGCLSFPAATNQAISVLVLDRKAAMPAYVLAWLNAKVEDWKRIASSSRKDPNITSSDVSKFIIVLPGLDEQQHIASCLSSLDALITAETQKLDALQHHKRGLMQQLFPSLEGAEA